MSSLVDQWTKLDGNRSAVLARARDCSELTLPYVLPPEGTDENTELHTPYQSLGARGVNNLQSKMLLALFPTNTPFFRMFVDEDVQDQLDDATSDAIEAALRKQERKLFKRIETGNLRTTLGGVLKHLIVTGNALLYLPKKGNSRMYSVDRYVVQRDSMGTVIKLIVKEEVHPDTLPEKTRVVCQITQDDQTKKDDVAVYTLMELKPGGGYKWRQEINDITVPGSEGESAKDETPPFIPLRWQSVPGHDYGIGIVEEYMGDLRTLEGLMKSVYQFSAVASKIVLLLHPNATTDDDALTEAESGDIVEGNINDIDVLQLDKYADFRVAKSVIDDLVIRLSHAFLLQSGTVRDAERVTAAEISAMAQELEDVLGGVYTVQSQELQLPIVKRLISSEKDAGNFPKFPKVKGQDVVQPVIVTGFDALGRGHELNKLRAYMSDLVGMVGEQQAAQMIDARKIADKLAEGHNVDVEDFLKSPDQIAQDNRQQQMAQMAGTVVDKAAGPVASEMMKQQSQE